MFAMQCNIDGKGRIARLICGALTITTGVVLLVLAGVGTLAGWWPWVAGGLAVALGAFQVYESWCGWCVMRAMGFKTPM